MCCMWRVQWMGQKQMSPGWDHPGYGECPHEWTPCLWAWGVSGWSWVHPSGSMSGKFIVGGSSMVYTAHMHKRNIEYKLTSAAMGDNTWRTMCGQWRLYRCTWMKWVVECIGWMWLMWSFCWTESEWNEHGKSHGLCCPWGTWPKLRIDSWLADQKEAM